MSTWKSPAISRNIKNIKFKLLQIIIYLTHYLTAKLKQEGVSPIKGSADINKLAVLLLILRQLIKDTVIEGSKILRTAKLKNFHDTMSFENWTSSKLFCIFRCVKPRFERIYHKESFLLFYKMILKRRC